MTEKTAKVRLRDPGTMFTDPDSDFSLSGNEVRPLPKRQGQTLTARIRTGAIILVDDPPKKEQKPKTPNQMNKTELLAEIGKRDGLGEKLTALAREHGKEKPEEVANKQMATLIIDFDNGTLKQRTGDPATWSREELCNEILERDGEG